MAAFTLEVLRARKGDCLILRYGSKSAPKLMVIDGGPANVYKPQLRKRLKAIKAGRKLADGKPLAIDVLMVSHVDDDHIRGVLELSAELRLAKEEQQPAEFRVTELWHNSFDKLLKTTPKQLKVTASSVAQDVVAGEPSTDEERDLRKVLASVAQGATLRDDAKFLSWSVNAAFGDELVMATEDPNRVSFDNLELTVLGPMQSELKALSKKHDQWLKQVENGESSLAAFTDPSVTNLSSLVLLVAAGDRTMLLTGDARGDKILEGLELSGVVDEGGEIEVDLFKVPHHGSTNNSAPELFERIRAQHYVFSGDGEHGNPERETIEMLLDARGADAFDLYFTYPLAEIDEGRKADWEREREKEKKKDKPKRPPRPAWSAAKHSLETLLEKANIPNRKQKVHIVEDGQSLPIHLDDTIL
jgi:hypothetical protein